MFIAAQVPEYKVCEFDDFDYCGYADISDISDNAAKWVIASLDITANNSSMLNDPVCCYAPL